MKKTISLSLAVVAVLSVISVVNASNVEMDELSYNPSSPALKQERQDNYLSALVRRYKNIYNNARHHRYYYNTYLQKDRIQQVKKENNIIGSGSEMNRSGEMEQGRERVKPSSRKRVQAVNAKQTFRKAAIDYYVDGGQGYGSLEAMEMGNVDGMNNVVKNSRMMSDEYRFVRGATNLSVRDMIRFAGMKRNNASIDKRTTYQKGNFFKQMNSPYMSTDWME